MKARIFFTVLLVSAGLLVGMIMEQVSAGASALAGSSRPNSSNPSATVVPGEPAAPDSSTTTALSEGFEGPNPSIYLSEFDSVVPTCAPGNCEWNEENTVYHSGTQAAFARDVANVADQQMTLRNPVLIPSDATAATLSFYHRYDFESPDYDGGVLEVSTDGTTWTDAGSHITSGGYTGTIHSGFQNPLAGRAGWVGTNGASFTQVTVNVLSYAGQQLFFRFRLGTDISTSQLGWYVDDVVTSFTAPLPCTQATWTQLSGLYPIGVLDPAVVELNGILYSFGGYTFGGVTAMSYKYDPTTNSWSAINPLPEALANAGAAVTNGTYIYIVGGYGSNGATNTLYRFDPATGTWFAMAPSPTTSYQHATVYLNGKIYRISGVGGGLTNEVQVYTIATNTWATAAPYPLAVEWPSAVAYNGYIYAAGGYDAHPEAKTYRYDPATNSWNDSAIADLPSTSGRAQAASGLLNGRWILATGKGKSSNDTRSAYVWNPATNTWSSMTQVLVTTERAGAAVIGQSFYMVGGSQPAQDYSTMVQKYMEPSCANTPTPAGTATRTVTRTATRGATGTVTRTTTRTFTPAASRTSTRSPTSGPSHTPLPASPTNTPGTSVTTTACPVEFTDVPPESTFYAFIRCLACQGIVGGYTTNPPCTTGTPCFLPGNNVTRGQMAKFIANAAGFNNTIPPSQQTFTDVPPASPFWVYIERVYAHGVVNGYTSSPPCTTGTPCFLPGNDVTRGQAAKFVSIAAAYSDTIPPSQQSFTDVPPPSPFWLYVERAYLHGVISGYTSSPPCTTGTPCFLPGNDVTRGQTAKFISNAFFPSCSPQAIKKD